MAEATSPAEPQRQWAARVVLDASGGDAVTADRISGACQAAEQFPDTLVTLCGVQQDIEPALEELGGPRRNIQIVDAPQQIAMHESPVRALREKKGSSIVRGIEMVAAGEADAFVSAGNTGAVAAAATLKLGRLEGVQRPGIAAAMRIMDYPLVAIDVGANVDCRPTHLLQYGAMAEVFARNVIGIEEPRVGLLNVGEEDVKGNELTKQAFDLLSEAELDFIGNVEPRQLFEHGCDIVVCDGFVGNIILKMGESLTLRVIDWLRQEVGGSLRYKIGFGLCWDLFKHLKNCADYAEYGGAPLLGVRGVTIITHGASRDRAIRNAIREARSAVQLRLNEHIEEAVQRNAVPRGAQTA